MGRRGGSLEAVPAWLAGAARRGALERGERRRTGAVTVAALACAAVMLGAAWQAPFALAAAPVSAHGNAARAGAALAARRAKVVRERAHQSAVSLKRSDRMPYWACPEGACEAIVDPPAVRVAGRWQLPGRAQALEGSGKLGGYDPEDLQSAYEIPVAGGEQQQHLEEEHTIAVVDAGYDRTAEADLAEYRTQYGLDPCAKAGGCFRQVNEHGEEASPPFLEEEWDLETSLDLDMASAGCPHCHILLVEASEESLADLAESVNTAATLGATEISNSYGLPEEACAEAHCAQVARDYDHPGVVITAAAGDSGYDSYLRGAASPSFPAVSPYVIAVGGTSLRRVEGSAGRKWSEAVWWEPETRGLGTGSGCSTMESKPTWQTDGGCAGRTDNDVAAVGACETPVSVYSSYYGGWVNVCGTSVGSPLVAAIEVHASEAPGSAVPTADAFYQDRSSLYDVLTGRDGNCSPAYLCSAEAQAGGYDGPAGNGTPAQGPVAVAGEPPSVRTEPPGGGGALTGVLDSNGLETTYCFEYGTTTSYGACAPTAEASAGSSTAAENVSQPLVDLPPGLYHYRLLAVNRDGRSYGEDEIIDTTPPTVSGVAPDAGWTIGGVRVKVTGANFIGVTAVRFGSARAGNFKVLSATEIEAESPAGTGTVDVTVENAGGVSATGKADRFSYSVLPPPTVTGLAPAAGLSAGGAVVTITGTHLFEVSTVDFGSAPATRVEIDSETEIEAVAPAGTGSVDVTVTTPSGTSATGASDRFTYEAGSAGEPAWLSPVNLAAQLFGFPEPTVAMDARGDAAAVWNARTDSEFNSRNDFVEAAFRPAGGNWEAPVALSEMAGTGTEPRIAFDEHGDAVAVFALYSPSGNGEIPALGEVVQAAFRPAGGTWQKAVALSDGCEESGSGTDPSLAVDPAGDAVATWRCRVAGTTRVLTEAAYMPAGGSWQSPVRLAEASEQNGEETLSSPNVVIDLQGDATAGWLYRSAAEVRKGEPGKSEVAYRPSGGSWQASTELAEGGGTPELAVDGLGDAYALVAQDQGLAVAYRPAGRSWQSPAQIVPGLEGEQPYRAELAVDAQGDALVIWWQYKGEWQFVRATNKRPGGSWQKPVTLSRTCWAWNFCSPNPQVAFDARGDAVAIWQHQGSESKVTQAARLPAGGGWQAPVEISSSNTEEAWSARLGLDPEGNGVVVWEEGDRELPTQWTIQAASYTATEPAVAKVDPESGPASGETTVTITGERLNDATGVDFGSTAATRFKVISETEIEAVSPPGTGVVDVTVSTPKGTSTANAADRFAYQSAAAAVTGAASSLGRASATLNATVDPLGLAVSDCHFEYGTTTSYGSGVPCSALPGSGTTPVAVSAALVGLSSYTTYYFRIAATNADGTSYGSAQVFKTLPNPPTVATGSASSVAQATATLNATVNANEEAVSGCRFEYGTSPSPGTIVPCASLPRSTETPEPVSATVSGLRPNTTYYFRIVATDAHATSYGSVHTFTTVAPVLPEIGRCVKLAKANGSYKNAACTKPSARADAGKYEWSPWPAAKDGFSSTGGAATFETVGKASVKCDESRLSGEYTGSQTASVSLVFHGCEGSGALAGACHSEGADVGEIKSDALTGTLGFVKKGSKPSVGWDLSAVTQPDLASFACGTLRVSVVGSAIAVIAKPDKMSARFSVTYTAEHGKQAPERFEAGVTETLSFITEAAEEHAGLKLSDTLSDEEALEIKAIA